MVYICVVVVWAVHIILRVMLLLLVGVGYQVRLRAMLVGLGAQMVVACVMLEHVVTAVLRLPPADAFGLVDVFVLVDVPKAVVVSVVHIYFSKHGCLLNAP